MSSVWSYSKGTLGLLCANGDSGMQLGDVSKEELADTSTGIGVTAGTEAARKNGVL